MPRFSVKFVVAALMLLGIGFAGGYVASSRTNPVVKPDTTAVSKQTVAPLGISEIGPSPCIHFDGSMYMCPGIKGDSVAGDRLYLRGDSIAIGPISVTYRDSTYRFPVPGRADAIFFTPEAAQILVEHYRATDPTKATALQAQLDAMPRP